jgi:hypothetical protein
MLILKRGNLDRAGDSGGARVRDSQAAAAHGAQLSF